MSANIFTGGFIGHQPDFNNKSGIYGVGPNGLTLPTGEYAQVILDDNPVGFWLLDEAAGSTASDSTGSYDLTYLNNPTLQASGPSSFIPFGVTFNGSTQNAKGDNSATFTRSASQDWSIEAWIKFTSTSGTIFTSLMIRNTTASADSVTGAIIVNNTTPGVISAQTVSTGGAIIQINSSTGFNNGNWHHVVATAASGGNFTLYVNGTNVASSSTARHTNSSQRSVTVASNRSGANSYIQYFPGSIAACAYYNTTLSATRVSAHYDAGT